MPTPFPGASLISNKGLMSLSRNHQPPVIANGATPRVFLHNSSTNFPFASLTSWELVAFGVAASLTDSPELIAIELKLFTTSPWDNFF
jgi:hypothetical protein